MWPAFPAAPPWPFWTVTFPITLVSASSVSSVPVPFVTVKLPAMSEWPGKDMPEVPIGWYVIDEQRGWVVCEVWNRMRDPGDGSIHQAVNFTLLTQTGGTAQTWAWDFGDPASGPLNTSALENPPAHQYQTAGAYTVTLVETNPGGTSPTYSHSITVTSRAAKNTRW